jgi:hypothetical protein
MHHRPLSRRHSIARQVLGFLGASLVATAAIASEPAPGPAATPVQSLDEQVQEIKSDVLSIAAELGNLEEKLLYPSDTQLAVFVALDAKEPLEIDSARITLDGQLVAHHIYSFKELEALAKGGVQRIHTANVPSGGHQLEVAIAGRRAGDTPFEVIERFDFRKEVGPKKLGVRLAGGATTNATVTIEDW